MKPTLLILAAGMGSRYGGLKQIDPIGPNGEIIVDYSVYDAIRAGFGKVIFLIRHDIEKDFKEIIGNKFDRLINIEFAYQELDMLPKGFNCPAERKKPWGTGHAVLCAADKINEPFVVINADDFYGHEAFANISEFLQSPDAQTSMVGFKIGNTLSEFGGVSRGVCSLDCNNNLTKVNETHNIQKKENQICYPIDNETINILPDNTYVSMNFWGFTADSLKYYRQYFNEFLSGLEDPLKSEFYIPTVVNNMITSGLTTCKVLKCDSKWFGVTYKEDKPAVESAIKTLIKQGIYPSKLFS